ncbi:acyl-CoA dehydrogenase family protein [Nocardioides sp. cx-173]|uniref:acyl-CoA dehydrogenase family protein n=1 Tax=Nocardioides sp. cx-173 TaxID=2898796 RepID=UPI001E4FD75A|nr:acyl-CoA dehydrogenase family protein [Nocardioides sp. cx-173]MCD4524271.1 acyl-CoA/acyl-ACP dehydrogenase [Nocardioides sp. cx-173]UGB41663.1 acyl-CoA/acyl-ACP dehydrogenase [Nocardioides sp. cx-173]
MSASPSEEQEQLRRLVHDFLQDRSPVADARRLAESGADGDRAVWTQMAEQLRLQALVVPEEHGGDGYGPAELGIVLEQMGGVLLVSPYFATVAMAAQTLIASGDETAMRRWLPGIADGATTATLALAEDSGAWDAGLVRTQARSSGDAWLLTGSKSFVVHGHTADLVLVVARTPDGVGVFAVEADAPGLTRAPMDVLDPTRPLATVQLDETPATRVGTGDASGWLASVTDLVLAASAAEQVGGAAACLAMAVDYAKVREQFGRPIGSFQAIKHKCSTMLLQVECGRSAAYAAGAAVATPGPEASTAAAVAKAYCSQAFTHVAKECLQIHGGVGFTWEHDAHLYLRRAKSSELLFGSPASHRARLAELVGI